MSKSNFLRIAVAVALITACHVHSAAAACTTGTANAAVTATTGAVASLPGMDAAANMKEWLKLTDDQVAKLAPVIETRVTKTDAAFAKLDASEDPDKMAFVKEYGAIKSEFDAGVAKILTPDQLKQWGTFKAAVEKDLVRAGAVKKVQALTPAMKLTDDQAAKLEPAMAAAMQKKLDAVQKIADGGRISARDKLKTKNAIEDANSELEKAMAAVVSPDQLTAYKAAMESAKKK